MENSTKEPRIISFMAHKGGVLKTTLSFNLAKQYIRNNRSVTVVDLDQQKSIQEMLPSHTQSGVKVDELKDLNGDYVIVDTGPTFEQSHIKLLLSSNIIVVPCQLEGTDIQKTVDLLETAKALSVIEKIKIVVVHSGKHTVMYKLLRPTFEDISREFGVEIICEIQKNQSVSQANLSRQSVFEAKTAPQVRKEYKEFFKGVGKCLVQ
jgi:cellulose biosynthesis protein BcsQ